MTFLRALILGFMVLLCAVVGLTGEKTATGLLLYILVWFVVLPGAGLLGAAIAFYRIYIQNREDD